MKPSKHIDEPTGRMVNNHGHWEYQYDPPVARKSDAPGHNLESYQAVELRRRKDGWTAERQRTFLNVLANTGSVAHAAEAADITPRSAYRLRNHPQGGAFAKAMEAAQMTGARRLLGVAFERAITGTPRQIWRGGQIVAEQSVPSDTMLMFLLRNLLPDLFHGDGDPAARATHIAALQGDFAGAMAALTDLKVEADLLDVDDYRPKPPHEEAA